MANKMLSDILKSADITQPIQTYSSPDDTVDSTVNPEDSTIQRYRDILAKASLQPGQRFNAPLDQIEDDVTNNNKPVSGMGDSLKSSAELPKATDDSDMNKEVDDAEDNDDETLPASVPLSLNTLKPMNVPDNTRTAMQDAQNRSNTLSALMMMGKGAEKIGSSIARTKSDPNYLNEMQAMAQQPVADVLNNQKSQAMQTSQQAALRDLALKQDADDPNSDVSNTYRNILKYNFPNLKTDGLTASQMEEVFPALKAFNEAQESRDARADLQDSKNKAKKVANADKLSTMQDKAYTDLRKSAETFRGNQAAQQAAKDVLSGAKAFDMINIGDPNKLTTQDLRLLMGEMGKIATGGVPTEQGTTDLMPNNLKTKYAQTMNFLTSNPTDAQSANYIQHNKQYLKAMIDTAQQTLNNFRLNTAKGYKNRVRPEDWDEFLTDYNLKPNQTAQQPSANISGMGLATIREKATGKLKSINIDDAKTILADPRFERVQ